MTQFHRSKIDQLNSARISIQVPSLDVPDSVPSVLSPGTTFEERIQSDTTPSIPPAPHPDARPVKEKIQYKT